MKCGDRIGTYERVWLERSDGGIEAAAWLSVADDLRRDPAVARLFHLGCLVPEHFVAPST